MTSHLVIGDGITAAAFVENVPLESGDQLTVLGRNASELGRGIAYAAGEAGVPWRFAYLLNSPADDIDPAFARWLSEHWETVKSTMEGRAPNWLNAAQPLVEAGDIYGVNAPREIYGDFMDQEVSKILSDLRARGIDITLVDGEATSIAETDEQVTITTTDGQNLKADSVDIAPGGPSTLRIPGDDGAFSVPTLFGNEHRIAKHIEAGDEIFCIGGNASMLDALRLCQSLIPNEQLRFVVCAPDGEVPPPLVPRLPRKLTTPKLTTGHTTAESFLSAVEETISQAKTNGDEMREIRAGFRAHFLDNPLTDYITDIEEARRVPAQLRFWLRGGTRDTIWDMNALLEKGQTTMMTGFAMAVEHGDRHPTVVIRDPETGAETLNQADFFTQLRAAMADAGD